MNYKAIPVDVLYKYLRERDQRRQQRTMIDPKQITLDECIARKEKELQCNKKEQCLLKK